MLSNLPVKTGRFDNMLSNLPVKTGRFDNTFRNLIISNLIGQFNLVMVEMLIFLYKLTFENAQKMKSSHNSLHRTL